MKLQQFIVDRPKTSRAPRRSFFQLAQKNVVKASKSRPSNLSQQIDKIVYGE